MAVADKIEQTVEKIVVVDEFAGCSELIELEFALANKYFALVVDSFSNICRFKNYFKVSTLN